MEGRTIARPNLRRSRLRPRSRVRFNGGPDNCPAKPGGEVGVCGDGDVASMEGRTIARPNAPPPRRGRRRHGASMEGRTIARPNQHRPRRLHGPARRASMEGRTIARPNRAPPSPRNSRSSCFNGGPDNCPAKRMTTTGPARRRGCFNGGPDNCPAKRPIRRGPGSRRGCFNGGPDNCPAKPANAHYYATVIAALQWRAGQLPGQTRLRAVHVADGGGASMEGRTIARPNCTAPAPCRSTTPGFNGGPDNCPAKPHWPHRHRQKHLRASMEGRTIARPNSETQPNPTVRTFASMEGRTIARPNSSRKT